MEIKGKYFTRIYPNDRKYMWVVNRALEGHKSIWDLYNKPSYYKERAYNDLKTYFNQFDVRNYGCISGNCMAFTFGAVFDYINPYGEVIKAYALITKDNNYIAFEY